MKCDSCGFVIALAVAFVVLTLNSRADIIGIEPFAYADGSIAGKSGGTYWDFKNISPVVHTGTSSAWNNVVGAPNVISGQLVTDNNSARRQYNGANESDGAVNEVNVNKQVYYRVTVTTGPTLPDYFGLSTYDFTTERVFFGKPFGAANFGIQDVALSPTNSAISIATNTTYVLVVRVDYDDNLIRLYINPDLGRSEPATAAASASYAETFWSTEVRLSSGTGGSVTWDDLVVANEWESLRSLVTTAADEDNGTFGGGAGVSLREAVKYSFPGARIYFPPGLNGATITLTNEIVFNLNATIDASHLASGLTINGGPGTNRLFTVSDAKAATLTDLTLTGGNGGGAAVSGNGGAIYNGYSSMLDLARCTVTGNTGAQGGAVLNFGTLAMSQCLLTSNSASSQGGAIQNEEIMTLLNCTLVGNHAGNYGGAIETLDQTFLTHCTVTGNDVGGGGGGGGIDIYNAGPVNIANCIVAGNISSSGADIRLESSALNWQGANINQSTLIVSGMMSGPAVINANPLLAPLGNYGGPTRTMPPLPNSPAINAAGATTLPTDQRGFARPSGSAPDIGAVEVQNAIQTVIYDSLGFESPRFSLGTLVGQDGVNGPWLQSGTGAATVQNTNVGAGAQAVRVNRSGADARYAVSKTILNVGSSTNPIIAIEGTMKYQPANLPNGSFGPLFGMEVYDAAGNSPLLAASASVDATTAELIYQEPDTGFLTAVPGVTVSPNTWHSFRLELDYSSQTYRLFYDGREVIANAFVDFGIADFTDADITAIAANFDPTSLNASGTAFFDNYKVTAQSVPTQILSLQRTTPGQATISWTPTRPGGLLLETLNLSPANWTLSPSVSTNPVIVPMTSNKFYRLYLP